MSGVKAFPIVAGAAAAPASTGVAASSIFGAALATVAPAAGVILATGAVLAAGVAIANLGSQAVHAYQERVRRQEEAARQREQAVQQRIADLRSRVRANASKSKVTVKSPPTANVSPTFEGGARGGSASRPTVTSEDRDAQRKIQDLKSRLPNIESEYQALVNQGLLDAQTANQALQKTRQAVNDGNWAAANAHLQALDDARMQVIEQLRSQWEVQINYVQERLDGLRDRLPAAVTENLNYAIALARANWQRLSDQDLQILHQQISDFQAQADRNQETAADLVRSWQQVGYVARIVGIDDGDVVIEVETHEGANTQGRIQFDGQQMGLFSPRDEETLSCAQRTQEAMRIFQEQGYYLEWTHLDNQPVPEEWRQIGSPASSAQTPEVQTPETPGQPYREQKSRRRLEGQGY